MHLTNLARTKLFIWSNTCTKNIFMEKKYRLPKEFATKWLAALRSGQYQQAKSALFNGTGYCCLVVACIISGIENSEILGLGLPLEVESDTVSESFPAELLDRDNDLVQELTARNDGCTSYSHAAWLSDPDINVNEEQFTFPQIADWIEQNVGFY